jgi:hypothetical protein
MTLSMTVGFIRSAPRGKGPISSGFTTRSGRRDHGPCPSSPARKSPSPRCAPLACAESWNVAENVPRFSAAANLRRLSRIHVAACGADANRDRPYRRGHTPASLVKKDSRSTARLARRDGAPRVPRVRVRSATSAIHARNAWGSIQGSDAYSMTALRITRCRAIVLREGQFSRDHTFAV